MNALQALVSRLRRVLPDGVIEADSGGYRLAVAPDAVDVSRFERLVGQARAAEPAARADLLRSALALWRGTALADIALQDSDAFDAAVARLDELHVAALGDRVDADIRLGRGSELVSELTELVAAYPLREGFVAALMRALAEAGRGNEALTLYQRTRELLAEELGADPSAELSALHTALLRGELGERAENRRTNLRAELTSFVGKDADIGAVAGLAMNHRLVTLTGAGGSGKTRLAAETARTMLAELPDGAWLVELASVQSGGELAQAALSALGLRDQGLLGEARGGEPMDRLIAAVRERAILLILDNCEHLIEAAAAFADRLLGSAGGCGSWPRAGNRSVSPGRCCGRSSRSRCPGRGGLRRGRVLARGAAAAGPRGAGAQGHRLRRAHLVGHGTDLPGARRDPAGDRTGRGAAANHVRRSAGTPAR
nr:hypothetical protein GCM10020093_046850 [Planobispora longispora]